MRTDAADLARVPGINRCCGAGSSARGTEAAGNGAGFAADSGSAGSVPRSTAACRRHAPSSGVWTRGALVKQNGAELLAQPFG
jgi:hypothetical protein